MEHLSTTGYITIMATKLYRFIKRKGKNSLAFC